MKDWEYITMFGRVVAVHYNYEQGRFVLESIAYHGTDITMLLKGSGVWSHFEDKAREQIEEFLAIRN